jgi:hypothetical protein
MITAVYSTKETKPWHKERLIKSSGLGKNIEVIEYINNGEFSLTEIYNKGCKEAHWPIVVFLHDDIYFDTNNWGNKIIKHFESSEYGILGLAGTTDVPESGKWWEDRSKMIGIVNHESEGKKWESKYSKNWSNDIKDVVVVDGLFFAIHMDRLKTGFDENVKGFHFYEMDFVLANYLLNVKVGVIFNVRVTHKSIGMTNQQWEENRLQFVEKYKSNLPVKLVPDFYEPNDKSFNSKTPIKVIIQSSGDVSVFEKLYAKIRSFQYSILDIFLICKDGTYDAFKDLKYDGVKVLEGYYDSLPKNLSVLKFEDDFITNKDELVVLMNDSVELLNNIFLNAVNLYRVNKNTFGCMFPMSYSSSKTVFSSSLYFFVDKDNKVGIEMKDINTYYNVYYGNIINPFGNLADCMVTTATNLKMVDWLKVNFDSPLYFNEFALRLYLKNKTIYNDTNSLTVQKSFSGSINVQPDFQNILNMVSEEPKLQPLVKKIEQ